MQQRDSIPGYETSNATTSSICSTNSASGRSCISGSATITRSSR